jgi:hypothetical protein
VSPAFPSVIVRIQALSQGRVTAGQDRGAACWRGGASTSHNERLTSSELRSTHQMKPPSAIRGGVHSGVSYRDTPHTAFCVHSSLCFGALLRETDGQWRSGIHLPISVSTPTMRPHVSHRWFPHCAWSRFFFRSCIVSSLSFPSHGFAGIGINPWVKVMGADAAILILLDASIP